MTSTTIRRFLALAAAGALACASRPAAVAPPGATAAPATAPAAPPARATFVNPGGMWLPGQLALHAETLRGLGLELEPRRLDDPTAAPLGAVVSLGGCSGAFVSPDGLVLTNHHCVRRALQYNSTPARNLLREGLVARTRTDERWAGPTARIYVTTVVADVTPQVRRGLDAIADDLARHAAIEERVKRLTAECEEGRPGVRCRVAQVFEGARWVRFEQLELRDVRLVYAPAVGVGNFGGEIDNWRWPRHSADFAFYRAYVGPDGQPADHAAANVPYRPAHHLRLATTPLAEGDLVLVAGYPGRTARLATARELAGEAGWSLPRKIALAKAYLARLEQVRAGRPALQIKGETRVRSLHNGLTKFRGVLETLEKGRLVEAKREAEQRLRAWVAADPTRAARWGDALDRLDALQAEVEGTRAADAFLEELGHGSALLAAATTIVRVVEERGKADAAREPGFQERDRRMLEQRLQALDQSYARPLDRAVFALALERALAAPAGERPDAALRAILGPRATVTAIGPALDRLYRRTRLERVEARLALVRGATPASLRRSKDPFVRLALALRPLQREVEVRTKRRAGAQALVRPRYAEALLAFHEGRLAPDANGTLRVTFGTVKRHPSGGRAFTTLGELVAKITGAPPFDPPPSLAKRVAARAFGPYVAEELGEVPVDFLTDVDITGGNSGSATLNARGELVGVAFDGVYDTVASDYLYLLGATRAIHVDLRYLLWVLDALDGADALLAELGVEPAIDDDQRASR